MSPRVIALLGAIVAALAAPARGQEARAAPIEVRLGMVSNELSAGQAQGYQRLLANLSESSPRPIRARVAPGTYAEVLNWLDRGLIDVAVLTPALYAETLKEPAPGARRAHAPCRYLATEGAAPAPGHDPFRYRPVCLVRQGSPLREFGNLKKAAREKRVRFLLVDRLSASGHLAQRYALLKEAGIVLDEDQIEYTYSHGACLERLIGGKEVGKELVAFVSDEAVLRGPTGGTAALERVRDFPGLDTSEYAIPQDVWVARPGFAHFDLLRQLLPRHDAVDGGQHACDREDADRPLYERVGQWTDELGAAADKPASLDEIGSLLRHYRRRHAGDGAPRLALVFSGGGAKCAYQAGAVQEIEKKLGDDIGLVVGTSGGAINAVPVALGVTRDDPDLLAREWLELDLREVARPALTVCALLGVLTARLLALLWSAAWWAVRGRRAVVRWPVSLAAPVAWLVLPWVSSEWIDRHDWLRYLQIVLRFGFLWASLVLLALVVVVALKWARVRSVLAVAGLAGLVSLVALPLVLAFGSETLFAQEGMEATFVRRYTNLTRDALGDASIPDGASDQERLRALSRGIVARIGAHDNPLRRDLVITGSCLPPRPPGLHSSDLYFYLPAANGRPGCEPRFGAQGVALADRPDMLMDVIMGSGTIYPGFPASTVADFPRDGEQVKLIDGGFAHNSPVEAAVEWGATHILLIEASPKSEQEQEHERAAGAGEPGHHSLWHNAADAFNHLYDQAQLLDVRSREKVAIFTLRPKQWHLTVIDFSRGKMRDAIEAGRQDAAGANFERQHGEPRFLEAPEAGR